MTQRKATYLIGTPSGSVQDQDVSVLAATASADGNGLKLADYRFKTDGENTTVFGQLTSGASINLYIYPFPGNSTIKHLETVVSAASSSFTSATNTFSEVLNGPFWGIEAEKADGTGSAIVVAYL